MSDLTDDELDAFEYHGCSSGTQTPTMVRDAIVRACAELRRNRKARPVATTAKRKDNDPPSSPGEVAVWAAAYGAAWAAIQLEVRTRGPWREPSAIASEAADSAWGALNGLRQLAGVLEDGPAKDGDFGDDAAVVAGRVGS